MKQKYFIKEEVINGKPYFVIYQRVLFFWAVYYEKWFFKKSAEARLIELLNE
jgi:hypothetical protein